MRLSRYLLLLCLGCVGILHTGCASRRQGMSVSPMAAHVVQISEEFANINTDLSGERLATAGITTGTIFGARYGDERLEVLLGVDYKDVARGEWVGLIEEDGNLQIAISFGHAATVLGCVAGDTLFVTPIDNTGLEKKEADADPTNR